MSKIINFTLALLLLISLSFQEAKAQTSPDGIVNSDAATVVQHLNLAPVRQARTTKGEVFVTGRKSVPLVTVCPATTCGTLVKNAAGQVTSVQVFNSHTSNTWLKLYNKASAPTVGTDTPIKTILIPAGLGAVVPFPLGLDFTTGIAFAVTASPTVADTTAVTVNTTVVNIDYR